MTIINSLFLLWKMQSGNLLKLKVDAKIKSTDFFFFFFWGTTLWGFILTPSWERTSLVLQLNRENIQTSYDIKYLVLRKQRPLSQEMNVRNMGHWAMALIPVCPSFYIGSWLSNISTFQNYMEVHLKKIHKYQDISQEQAWLNKPEDVLRICILTSSQIMMVASHR